METMAGMHRSCGCGRVTEKDCGKELTLAGWVNTRRDHGGLILLIYGIGAALYRLS